MKYNILINKAIEKGFSDVEAYIEDSKNTTISLFNGEIDKTSVENSHVVTLRGIYKDKMAYISFENEDQDCDSIISKLLENAKVITTDEEFEIFAGSKEYKTLEKVDGGFNDVPMIDKVNLLKETEKEIRRLDSRIAHIPYCQYIEEQNVIQIVNSKGLNVSKSVGYCGLILQVVAVDGDLSHDGFEIVIKLKYNELNPKTAAKKAVEKALSMLGAQPIESKVYPVIIDNDAMSDILIGFSMMFSGDAAIKHMTSLVGKEGTKIMDEKINIIDDPLKEGEINSQSFDDEGVATYKKYVVQNGIFKTFLHNLKTAKYFNTTSTGNGVKAGEIGVSGINLYIEAGDKSKEELISSIDAGLLITDLAGLHAGLNPISGDFSAQASGYYIENGKIAKPVSLIVVSGNFLNMMSNIDALGSDLVITYRGIGCPSIKFNGLTVSGK